MNTASKPRRAGGTALLTLGFLALLMAALLSFVHITGTDGRLYEKLQLRCGVRQDGLAELDQALAEYLKGDIGALENAPFNEREILHMRDVFDLFALLRRALAALLCAAVALLAGGCALHGPGRAAALRHAAMAADGLLLALAMGFGLWAALDFTGLFHAFHWLLFTNDLWLLDPATDLLIRICPEQMFRDLALRIGLYTLLFAGCLPFLPGLIHRISGRFLHEIHG